MFNTVAAIEKLRHRPALYIGSKNINLLYAYIGGIECVLSENWTKNIEKGFSAEFYKWIIKKYPTTLTVNWNTIILKQAGNNEEAAVELFFLLFDEYLKEEKAGFSSGIESRC